MPLKEVLEEAEEGKRCKKEEDVVLMGHLLAQHLGSVESAAQLPVINEYFGLELEGAWEPAYSSCSREGSVF